MASVAGMLASALMRAGALEESRHRAARLAVGSAVAAALTDAQSPAEALKSAASTVFANSSYDLVAATIVLEDTQEQLLVSDLSRLGAEPGGQRRPLHAGVVGACHPVARADPAGRCPDRPQIRLAAPAAPQLAAGDPGRGRRPLRRGARDLGRASRPVRPLRRRADAARVRPSGRGLAQHQPARRVGAAGAAAGADARGDPRGGRRHQPGGRAGRGDRRAGALDRLRDDGRGAGRPGRRRADTGGRVLPGR